MAFFPGEEMYFANPHDIAIPLNLVRLSIESSVIHRRALTCAHVEFFLSTVIHQPYIIHLSKDVVVLFFDLCCSTRQQTIAEVGALCLCLQMNSPLELQLLWRPEEALEHASWKQPCHYPFEPLPSPMTPFHSPVPFLSLRGDNCLLPRCLFCPRHI